LLELFVHRRVLFLFLIFVEAEEAGKTPPSGLPDDSIDNLPRTKENHD